MLRVTPLLLVLCGAAACVLGYFMPWHTLGVVTSTGLDLADPTFVVAPSIVAALSIRAVARNDLGWRTALAAGIIGALSLSRLVHILVGIGDLERPSWLSYRVGAGLVLAIGGNALIVAGAAMRALLPARPFHRADAPPPPRGAAVGRAFLIATIVAAAVLAVGPETRVLLSAGRTFLALTLAALFAVLGLALRSLVGRVERSEPDTAVAEAVAARARELGVTRELELVVIRRTMDQRNVYVRVTGRGRVQLVICEGAEALYFMNRQAFGFLIDHEFGHIVANDAPLLQTSRGFVLGALSVLPVKVLALIAFAEHYRLLFPAAARIGSPGLATVGDEGPATTLNWPVPTVEFVSERFAIVGVVGLTIALLVVMAALYVIAVRAREFWADRFAHRVSPQPDGDVALLSHILGGAAARGSFFHPAHATRLGHLSARTLPQWRMWFVADLLLVVGLLSFRFGLGDSGIGGDYPVPVAIALSLAFFVVFYTAVSLLVEDVDDARAGGERPRYGRRLALLAATGALAGAMLAVALRVWLRGDASGTLDDAYGLDRLNIAQVIDYVALALSVPVAVLTCAASAIVVERWVRLRYGVDRRATRPFGALAAAVAIVGFGVVVEPAVRSFRAGELSAFRTAFLDRRGEENRLPRDLLAQQRDGLPGQADIADRLLYISYDYQVLCVPENRLTRQFFAPPMALFVIDQEPLRINPFDRPEDVMKRTARMFEVFMRSGSVSQPGGLTFDEFLEHVENIGRFDCAYYDAVSRMVDDE